MDLLDLWRGRLSYRKLSTLLDNLPQEGRFPTAWRNSLSPAQIAEAQSAPQSKHHGPWSQSDHLVARAGDRVDALIFMMSDGKGQRPEPFPRPGVDDTSTLGAPVKASWDDQISYLEAVRAARGASPSETHN